MTPEELFTAALGLGQQWRVRSPSGPALQRRSSSKRGRLGDVTLPVLRALLRFFIFPDPLLIQGSSGERRSLGANNLQPILNRLDRRVCGE